METTLFPSTVAEPFINSGVSTLSNVPFIPFSASITVELKGLAVIYPLIVCLKVFPPFKLTAPFTVNFVPISAFVTEPFVAV